MSTKESPINDKYPPICPVCGEQADLFYMNDESEIIGCQNCASVVDAWEGKMQEIAETYLEKQIKANEMRYRKAFRRKDTIAAQNLLKSREALRYILLVIKSIKI